jgi:hypothetical protein
MKTATLHLVQTWFDGLNRGDLDSLLELFGPVPRIRNAANPPSEGPDAARRLLEEFFDRTSARKFDVLDCAEGDGQVFASWSGELTFRPGIRIADVTLQHEVRVRLRGAERFRLDDAGRIIELDIVHETTSPVLAARQAATVTKQN